MTSCGRGILDGDGGGDDVGGLGHGQLLDELGLDEHLRDLDGGRVLDELGRLDGLLGLETGLEAGADGQEQVRSDHGLQQQLATGIGEGVAQARWPSGAR